MSTTFWATSSQSPFLSALTIPTAYCRQRKHPYAALLWLEFLASPEGQKLLDEAGPYEGSLFVRGTVQEETARGKKKSVIDWNHYTRVDEYERKIVEAYGFPKAE
jgi:ABC-type Fe3+ transport system substrate-binding protein